MIVYAYDLCTVVCRRGRPSACRGQPTVRRPRPPPARARLLHRVLRRHPVSYTTPVMPHRLSCVRNWFSDIIISLFWLIFLWIVKYKNKYTGKWNHYVVNLMGCPLLMLVFYFLCHQWPLLKPVLYFSINVNSNLYWKVINTLSNYRCNYFILQVLITKKCKQGRSNRNGHQIIIIKKTSKKGLRKVNEHSLKQFLINWNVTSNNDKSIGLLWILNEEWHTATSVIYPILAFYNLNHRHPNECTV